MAVVYKRGLFFKIKNKKAFVLSVVLLLVSLGALLVIHSINNSTVSVKEHADTKLSPTIAEYSANTQCQGQSFVVKYKIVIKTPPINQESSVTYALQSFFPSVVEKSWITYVSGGGEILGSSSIKWSGDIKANETKEFFYTLTIPGGKLKPGANFKNIAVLASSSGFKEQKNVTVVIDSCGAIVSNPILPSPTVTHLPTPLPTRQIKPVVSITPIVSRPPTVTLSEGSENNLSGVLGEKLASEQQNNEDSNSTSSVTVDTNNQDTVNNEPASTTENDSVNTSDTLAQPPQGAQLEATNINTGVFDSPITAIILLIMGVIIKARLKTNESKNNVVIELVE